MAKIPPINGEPDDLDLSYGSAMDEEYSVRRVDFGDNYSQRAKRGINNTRQRWRLVWKGISDADAETLRLFFKARGGVGLIEWKPYNQSEELKFTASGWSSQPSGFLVQDCSIELAQEYDL